MTTDPLREDEDVARLFHEAYERLAPSFGYETRKASAVPWPDVPENNRRLMTAVVGEVRAALAAPSIDVERLARAMANEVDTATPEERMVGDLWSLLSERNRDGWRERARNIAIEYASLTREATEPAKETP